MPTGYQALRWPQVTIQCGDQAGHVGRRVGGEAERLAGAGMGEPEPGRVQRLAREVQQRCGGPGSGSVRADGRDAAQVERVADHRVAAAGEVHADLVRPPGGEAAFQQGDAAPARRAACGSG